MARDEDKIEKAPPGSPQAEAEAAQQVPGQDPTPAAPEVPPTPSDPSAATLPAPAPEPGQVEAVSFVPAADISGGASIAGPGGETIDLARLFGRKTGDKVFNATHVARYEDPDDDYDVEPEPVVTVLAAPEGQLRTTDPFLIAALDGHPAFERLTGEEA